MSIRLHLNKGTLAAPARRPHFTLPEGFQTRGEYHITILGPDDQRTIKALKGWSNREVGEWVKTLEGLAISGAPQSLGIGTAVDGDNQVYFEVIEWPEAQEWRRTQGLGHKDLHVTVGFKDSDIHGVPKNRTTLISNDHDDLVASEIEALATD